MDLISESYVYDMFVSEEDNWYIERFPILKTTAKRLYFSLEDRSWRAVDGHNMWPDAIQWHQSNITQATKSGWISREAWDMFGEAYHRPSRHLMISWPRVAMWLNDRGSMVPQCLSVFGLQLDATRDDVLRAYRKLMLVHHPDHGGDGKMARELVEACEQALLCV